jgi:hypothetical protein
VWNRAYKEEFIDTILLGFPAPPIFVHEAMTPDGGATYSVVDGKQRLTTILEFVEDVFPVKEDSPSRHRGMLFSKLDDTTKRAFWTYQFSVEFLPTTDAALLDNIFGRLNKNVARLTRQELRRARFSGKFAASAESMADLMLAELPKGFPRIAESSLRQMKDVELVAQLLLLSESGPDSFSQDDLDVAYAGRDDEWDKQRTAERRFREVVGYLRELCSAEGSTVATIRLRNQADFYSLFGALLELAREKQLPEPREASGRLAAFVARVEDELVRFDQTDPATVYYQAARSASNDLGRRITRIEIVKTVLRASV